MHLSLTSWSLPACTLQEAADISKALGIGALDVGLFYRSALDKGEILSDPAAAAQRLAPLGVRIPNYYHLFGEGLGGRNLALPGTIDANAHDLEQVLTFADAADIATVFILPGSRATRRLPFRWTACAPCLPSPRISARRSASSRTSIPLPNRRRSCSG